MASWQLNFFLNQSFKLKIFSTQRLQATLQAAISLCNLRTNSGSFSYPIKINWNVRIDNWYLSFIIELLTLISKKLIKNKFFFLGVYIWIFYSNLYQIKSIYSEYFFFYLNLMIFFKFLFKSMSKNKNKKNLFLISFFEVCNWFANNPNPILKK